MKILNFRRFKEIKESIQVNIVKIYIIYMVGQ